MMCCMKSVPQERERIEALVPSCPQSTCGYQVIRLRMLPVQMVDSSAGPTLLV